MLEEQLKAPKNENKRLAARVQQSGEARDAEVEPEDACDEEEAANLDELQTLVDLSSKYFPDSVHNATLEKARCQASPSSDLQYVETVGEEAESESSCGPEDYLLRGECSGAGCGHR